MSSVIIPIDDGTLSNKGYSTYGRVKERREALERVIRSKMRSGKTRYVSSLSVYRGLIARSTRSRTRAVRASEIMRKDAEWVKKEYLD